MKRGKFVAALSALAAILSAVLAYAVRVSKGDDPTWLTDVIRYRSRISVALLALAVVVTVLDLFRAYLDNRHQTKLVLDKILNELSRALFPQGARQNLITSV